MQVVVQGTTTNSRAKEIQHKGSSILANECCMVLATAYQTLTTGTVVGRHCIPQP